MKIFSSEAASVVFLFCFRKYSQIFPRLLKISYEAWSINL